MPGRGTNRPARHPDAVLGREGIPSYRGQTNRVRMGLSVRRRQPVNRRLVGPVGSDGEHGVYEPSSAIYQGVCGGRCACGPGARSGRLASGQRLTGAPEYHVTTPAAVQPGVEPGRASMGLSQKSLPQQSCLSGLHRSLQSLRPSLEPTHGPTTLLDLSHGMDTAREVIDHPLSGWPEEAPWKGALT